MSQSSDPTIVPFPSTGSARANLDALDHRRINELDIVRGFAVFGVLWMNLQQQDFIIPAAKVLSLSPTWIDETIEFLSAWLMHGKAQALFSMLFGLGFALFLDRAEKKGNQGNALYLRRLVFLLVLGFSHASLLWLGDILNAYALMGFLLLLTRRWSTSLLLVFGVFLCVFTNPIVYGLTDIIFPHHPASWFRMDPDGVGSRFTAFYSGNYGLFVTENVRFLQAVIPTPLFAAYLLWIFGRFLIGSWIYRQNWFRALSQRDGPGLPRSFGLLLPIGLVMALPGPVVTVMQWHPVEPLQSALLICRHASEVVLALGYASSLILLSRSGRFRRSLDLLGGVGRMALTSYLCQSLIYFFVLDGFGLGLLRFDGQIFSLLSAVGFFAIQLGFSNWWLKHYQFGPVEWLWRSFTYSKWQTFRRLPMN